MSNKARQDVCPGETIRSGEDAVRVDAATLASSVARRSRSPFPRGPRPLSIVAAIGLVAIVSVAAFWFWHKRSAERNMVELPQFALPAGEIADEAADKVADEVRSPMNSKDDASEPTSQPTKESAKTASSATAVVEPTPTKRAPPEAPPEPSKNVIRIPLRPLSDLTDPG